MNPVVIYSSHRSNTAKIAVAIAQTANCEAVKLTKNINTPSSSTATSLDGYDLIFLGTGIRGGEPYVELLNFIKTTNLGSDKRFELFMTGPEEVQATSLLIKVSKKHSN